MSLEEVNAYLNGTFRDIEGWCIPHLWQCIQPLAAAAQSLDGSGPIAEIGVYHGKFFIGLLKTMGASQHNTAIDVFDMQEFNIDKAGIGSDELFRRNLTHAGVPEGVVDTMKTDSMWLKRIDAEALQRKTGGFSMFSVDGCHLAEHTINDILFAMEVVKPQGIIFVDDYYNPNWPGVQEGVAKFYLSNAARFVPLLYTCNKLFLCNLSYHKIYLDRVTRFVRQNFTDTRMKMVRRFGFDTVTVVPNLQSPTYLAQGTS